ncbi:MAG: hypothetical protein J1E82_07875, partial [Muribaculaceae bacterium]|nr:hypothetical protein [Muribaculaceae bacterium]
MKKIYYSLLAALGLAGTAMAVSSTGGLTRAESDYDVVGTYELTVQKTDLYGDKDLYDPVKIEVEVRQNGDDYCIAEIGDTDLFKGYIVPFTYNPTNKYATFDPAYVSPLGDAYLWVSAFAFNGSFAEPQPSFGVIFTPEDGFSFPTDNEEGIAWYLSGSDSEFAPENMYNGFYIYGQSSSDDSGDNGGEESGQYANPAVEGNWTITLDGHYMGQWSSGEETFTYVATLEGNTVTFECQGYGDNIVAEFTAENTLTFKKAVIRGEEAVMGTYQVPYINNNGIEDLDELEADIVDSFSATYNPADGSLTLPENCGFLYGIFNNTSGELSYWNDAFDLVSANQEVSGSDEPQPDYADESIVGDWNITLNGQYLGDYSLGQFTETFSASLDGNKVIFESTGSNYNIVAEFTAPGVLTFKKAIVGNPESTYGLNQVPYINNNDATDTEALEEDIVESFEATYNSFNNTITFPENCGLLYGMFNNTTGVLSYYEDAYDFVSAVKVAKEAPNYANESIVGNWDFTLNGNYLGEYSLGQFTETFTASLEGNIVTFESSQSQYNIVAEFIGENMLKFNFCPVGPEATFTLYQSPFINSDESKNIDDLTEVSFVATYKEDTNSIVFPEMSGLRYGYFNAAGELSYWDDAFDFVSAVKSSKETPSFANESIVGNWDITLDGHYLGEYSIGQFTETFEASLEGNIVTFASTQSQFNIVAEFVAENTLKFNQ